MLEGFVGTVTGKTGKPGHMWVEDTYFHYIDAHRKERKIQGTKGGATNAKPGYIWYESPYFRYIDSTGHERYIEMGTIGGFPYTFPFFFSDCD